MEAFGNTDLEPRASGPYIEAIKSYQSEMSRWFNRCNHIDRIYSGLQSTSGINLEVATDVAGSEYNLYWASMEVLKPSLYSRPPIPVVSTKFKDRSPVKRVTAELLERAAMSGFEEWGVHDEMLDVRDDLAISSRGQLWLSYEDDGEERVCIESLHRDDFAHDPVRRWREVSWVAKRAWLTRREMRDRFGDDAATFATYTQRRDSKYGSTGIDEVKDTVEKAAVWEVWDKIRDKVVWVHEGIEEVLDMDEPHLKLKGFFPCPPPAYGTRERGTLQPVPDYVYIQDQLATINVLTQRIHDLADLLRVIGIIPGASDLTDALQTALRTADTSSIFIPVPQAAFTNGEMVTWMPLDQVASTILAAVQERQEIINNVQELLGVSDIMRGDTEAVETLGAQQLKAQYGSRRTRDRVKELERIARDAGRIMVEIFAEEFDIDTLLMMAQMELPTEAEVKRSIKEIEQEAKKQIKALEEQVAELAEQDPEKAQQAAQQAEQQSQAIIAQASQAVGKAAQSVTYEAVKELLEDTKTDPFIFDIETDSTIYPDEMAEKQARNEFMGALANGVQALMPMVQSGGAEAAGEILKWNLDVYRPPRSLTTSIDEWIEALKNAPADDGAGDLAKAQMALAEAEAEKARAQMAKVEADATLKAAELQGKQQQMQAEFQEKAAKLQLENGKLQLQASKQEQEFQAKMAEMDAKQNLMQAQTAEILAKIGLDVRKQDLEEYRVTADTAFREQDQMRATENQQFDQAARVSDLDRAERGQSFSEQQTLAERQAEQPNE
jgi:hypothetical protein